MSSILARPSFYWHDYETFGTDPRRDRPAQFAGQRTTLDLEPVGEPLTLFCKPAPDVLPQPASCLVTGITPQQTEREGVIEAEFAARIHEELAVPQTCAAGFNSIRFDDGSSLKEIPRGKGRIYWASYPVELSEDVHSSAELYAYVAAKLNLTPEFDAQSPLPPGILVFPTVLADSVLYVLVSDSADDAPINLRDHTTGVQLSLSLSAEHAALALISKRDKKVIAKYGF